MLFNSYDNMPRDEYMKVTCCGVLSQWLTGTDSYPDPIPPIIFPAETGKGGAGSDFTSSSPCRTGLCKVLMHAATPLKSKMQWILIHGRIYGDDGHNCLNKANQARCLVAKNDRFGKQAC